MIPSFYAMVLSGLLLLVTTIYILYKSYQQYYGTVSFDSYQIVMILLVLSIAYGIHGLLHAAEEKLYDFNPLEGKWLLKENK
jgi:hypothetical protein